MEREAQQRKDSGRIESGEGEEASSKKRKRQDFEQSVSEDHEK